ncbi:MAG: penicillin-insensitive murein endopeptidase, partial [Myxococcales bacterium]
PEAAPGGEGAAEVTADVESAAADEPDDEDGAEEAGEGEANAQDGGDAAPQGLLYSADLSDEELARRFVNDLASLGSISVGFAEAGRLINGVQMPPGDGWVVVSPEYAWGTQETIDFLIHGARAVREKFPDAPPLRVNHIGKREGGYLRPHKTHQSGRDVDLGFYYRAGVDPRALRGHRETMIDLDANWTLVRALITGADVQVILVDKRVQKVLYDHALAQGEDRAWLDSLFRAGSKSIFQHVRGHRDHFHVRFYAARPQELGRRVHPLLARRPDQNLLIHRVRKGDTLGHLATRYGSSVKAIQQANRLRGTFLKLGMTLTIPLRGPCTRCPLPPAVIVPPRRLPPEQNTVAAEAGIDAPEQDTPAAPVAGEAAAEPPP